VHVCACVCVVDEESTRCGRVSPKEKKIGVRACACMNGTLVKEYNFFYSDERQQPHPPALTIPLVPVF